tara:strand:- start:87 stop:395 length:309 start_codon:yes stop_codon:yes gene_type:complete
MEEIRLDLMSYELFTDMLYDILGEEESIGFNYLEYISPAPAYASYIAADGNGNQTVRGIVTWYSIIDPDKLEDDNFRYCMYVLKQRLIMIDDIGLFKLHRLN